MTKAEQRLRGTVRGVALGRLLDLFRREDGAALVVTLAMFFLMYLACVGVYAVSTAVRERIHLQNAADAAAYSAAVVQADTLSRVATLNRAMAWTYEQMTRRQLDYIVHRWLDHSLDHYEEDRRECRKYHSCTGNCKMGHKFQPRGWYIGSHDKYDHIQLNGFDSPEMNVAGKLGLTGSEMGALNLGSVVSVSQVKGMLAMEDMKISMSLLDSDVWAGESATLRAAIALLRADSLYWSKSNSDTFSSLERMVSEIDGPKGKAVADSGMATKMLKRQILSDRLNIAAMNVAERNLVHEMPKRIEKAVEEIVKSNVPAEMQEDCLFYVKQNEDPLKGEETHDPSGSIPGGYFENLHNGTYDERRFMKFAGFKGTPVEEHNSSAFWCNIIAGGVEQWFVRGNGWRRTDGGVGLQRSYKHWAEGLRSSSHAARSPYAPTCFNNTNLDGSPTTIALHSSWAWFSGKWICYDGLFVHFHLGYLFDKKCPHEGSTTSFTDQILGFVDSTIRLLDVVPYVTGIIGGVSSPSSAKTKVASPDPNDKGAASTPIEKYKDGCNVCFDIFRQMKLGDGGEIVILPFKGYSRLYADAPHLYNSAYVGERAKPLILKRNYFGPDGTITVGVARKNKNVWERILGKVEGLFKAFDPDWNGEGSKTWSWAFASAKAGLNDGGSGRYRVDWREKGAEDWNLCRSDWDAVFVPVPRADATALEGAWIPGTGNVMRDAVGDTKKWKRLSGGGGGPGGGWSSVSAPKGMEGGGSLNWGRLGDVTYH